VLAGLGDGDQAALSGVDPAAAVLLARWRPARSHRGLVVLFTGLSGSGKSTMARETARRITAESDRSVSLLDGDVVRRMLSSELGFDKASRDLNVRRIGFVAAEIAKHGGTVLCAPIAPYAATRAAVRRMVEAHGDFVLVHVATPIEECEKRDLKGLYAKARAGLIPEFTGVSDPYETPDDAELTIDTSTMSRAKATETVMHHLRSGGWLSGVKALPTFSSGAT
jgi:sulfate adenylyltransferase